MKRTPLPAPLDSGSAARPTRFDGEITLPDGFIDRLAEACPSVTVGDAERIEAGRDWWPLSTSWALEGQAPSLPAVVVRPDQVDQVAAVMCACSREGVPVTPFAGMSGVCGGAVPLHGGVSMDMTGLAGVSTIDDESLLVRVGAGTFGPDLEAELRAKDLTLGHWPQSVELSTVGGWLACRGAGQYSTRYGKIEDMVSGLEVVLADGTYVETGGRSPRAATGPDLTQLFVGSEGTLGVITGATLRVRPAPSAERRAVFGFDSFDEGLDCCRRILRRWATPAVLRLYDRTESGRQFDEPGENVLIVVDEGDAAVVDAVMTVVSEEVGAARPLDEGLAGRWLEHRNHLPSLADLYGGGLVVDTVEVAARWSVLSALYHDAVAALQALPGTLAASAHQSHAYSDGACLYFTFAGKPADPQGYYRQAFDAVMAVTDTHGGAISHHHGVGLNRSRYLSDHLGAGMQVLRAVKAALDPAGVLNPGKMGLPDPFA